MDWITTTAGTVEEAQSRALDLLGVDSSDAEIQVIEEGKKGLFGRTKTEARVRARIKPKAPPAKEERRSGRNDNRRNRNQRGRGGSGGSGGSKKNSSRGGQSRGGQGGNQSGQSRGGQGGNQSGQNSGGSKRSADRAKQSSNSGGSGSSGRGGQNKGGQGGGTSGGGGSRRSNSRNRRDDQRDQRDDDRVEMPIAEQRETLQGFVEGVAKAFDPESTVNLVEEGTTLQADVEGPNLGELVGAKAATLQTLEELARTAMHRAAEGRRYHRIRIDVDSYRARRREALTRFATDLADQVVESRSSKALEPMNAADRKLVHDAVGNVAGVETQSQGRDPRRYIVIVPLDVADEEEE